MRQKLSRALSVFLLILIVGGIAGAGYIYSTAGTAEKFTEFYLLGADGKATDYPAIVRVNEESPVIAGIVNHEQASGEYFIRVISGDTTLAETGPVFLADEEKWENLLYFRLTGVGEKQKVEFILFRDGERLLALHLWIDVIP